MLLFLNLFYEDNYKMFATKTFWLLFCIYYETIFPKILSYENIDCRFSDRAESVEGICR